MATTAGQRARAVRRPVSTPRSTGRASAGQPVQGLVEEPGLPAHPPADGDEREHEGEPGPSGPRRRRSSRPSTTRAASEQRVHPDDHAGAAGGARRRAGPRAGPGPGPRGDSPQAMPRVSSRGARAIGPEPGSRAPPWASSHSRPASATTHRRRSTAWIEGLDDDQRQPEARQPGETDGHARERRRASHSGAWSRRPFATGVRRRRASRETTPPLSQAGWLTAGRRTRRATGKGCRRTPARPHAQRPGGRTRRALQASGGSRRTVSTQSHDQGVTALTGIVPGDVPRHRTPRRPPGGAGGLPGGGGCQPDGPAGGGRGAAGGGAYCCGGGPQAGRTSPANPGCAEAPERAGSPTAWRSRGRARQCGAVAQLRQQRQDGEHQDRRRGQRSRGAPDREVVVEGVEPGEEGQHGSREPTSPTIIPGPREAPA